MPASLFNYFNIYRVIIAALLVGMTFTNQYSVSDFRSIGAFQWIAVVYFVLSLITLLLYRYRLNAGENQIFITCLIDICILHGLFSAGEGITGGLSNLVIISVAAANIMLRGAPAYFIAAVATILSLTLATDRYFDGDASLGEVAWAGVAGAIYFATAFALQYLSLRISQSEQLAEEQQQDIAELQALNHQIIQSMRTGILVCDEKMKVLAFNNACSDLIGMSYGKRIPEPLVERINAWLEMPGVRAQPFQVSSDLPMVQANFSSMHDGDRERTLVFLEDTRLLTQQAQQLKLASLGRLTASIAHEVRNPLGAISHATQLLAESDSVVEADQKMIDIIQRHCKRMNGIIENTLTLSRRGEPEIRQMALAPWLRKVIQDFSEAKGSSGNIDLQLESERAVANFDPGQMEQVITNLLGNALHHGAKKNPDSHVNVALSLKKETGQAIIRVTDQGFGVSEENQKHLFEPFFTTENAGTGLGLYISRELCEANQANLSYEPCESGGSCFKVVFAHHKRIV